MTKPRWDFPPESTLLSDDDYAELETIDISVVDLTADPAALGEARRRARDDTVARALRAFGSGGLGMVHVTGHGVGAEEIQRQFDVGSVFFDRVADEEKGRYVAKISEEGSWAGYKPRGYYGPQDCDENFNFYPETLVHSCIPPVARQFLHDYRRFLEHNHYVVVGKMLCILSLALGLPGDTLWRLHHRGGYDVDGTLQRPQDTPIYWKHSQDHFRFQVYNPRKDDESFFNSDKLYLRSHRDIGTITLNYSQPVAALQVLKPEGKWAWVRHKPGAIIVNLGHALEALTSSRLRAAFHRVAEPPEDQRRFRRIGIHYFVKLLPDMRIDQPLLDGPDDQFEEYRRLGGKPILYGEWERFRSKLAFRQRPARTSPERTPEDALLDLHYRMAPPTTIPAAKL
ncbi:uncharacterized protein PHACADRAFT_263216 [Phanerochaete carnosa HHB-10118-sp]|uniref:Isopenicillin N synthase-like Fe(2+) 2OG dioxygenase domain-containing protein n=1 Tax=Phanerochaete carnosa (strain HHB-10118-sp) TaxID=650164 RepID=K5VX69_PHACS|nr:uncharacterized protein PHACADRAFT_263216 [Phanerochaete carnosa HHB-10118-sp]EKM51199.1 hypothetical protein PHACADRAFT_263216 [Phanerochaete carnosa HHB-10118-sp]